MTLGLSIGGAVFVNTAENGLAEALPNIPEDQITQLVAGTSNDIIGTLSSGERIAALEVIVGSYQKVFICIYVAAAISLIASILMKVSGCLWCNATSSVTLTHILTERSCQHQSCSRWWLSLCQQAVFNFRASGTSGFA